MKKQNKILLRCNLYFICTEKPKDLEISLVKRVLEDDVVDFLKKKEYKINPWEFSNSIMDGPVDVSVVTEKEAIISLK